MSLQVQLTKSQFNFLTSKKKYVAFVAGLGSGKSFVGSHWAKNKIATERYAPGLICANTYSQLRDATLVTFFSVLDQFNIPYLYNTHRGIITVADRTIYAKSLDNFNSLRGIEVGWAWVDELRDAKKEAWDVLIGRVRHKNAVNRQIRATTTPNGFDWIYELFGKELKPGYEMVTATTLDNPFLPKDYVESLKDSYDELIYKQEVLGQFVNSGYGQVYYAFKRDQHIKPIVKNNGYPVYIGMDFNINPMTAVALQVYNNEVYVLKEYYIMSSNTDEMAIAIKNDFGNCQVIPDSTGKALKTSSRGLSDHEILRQHGHIVMPTRNPARMDRYNSVNNLFDKGRVFINPSCVKLIRDLEQVSFKEGSNEPDTTKDKTLTHISDALGYGVWFHFPIIKPSGGIYQFDR